MPTPHNHHRLTHPANAEARPITPVWVVRTRLAVVSASAAACSGLVCRVPRSHYSGRTGNSPPRTSRTHPRGSARSICIGGIVGCAFEKRRNRRTAVKGLFSSSIRLDRASLYWNAAAGGEPKRPLQPRFEFRRINRTRGATSGCGQRDVTSFGGLLGSLRSSPHIKPQRSHW